MNPPLSMFRSSLIFSRLHSTPVRPLISNPIRSFTTTRTSKMPEQLKQSEIDKSQDPTVAKQWDDDTPTSKKFEDFASIADGFKVVMMGTLREGIGVRPRIPHNTTN